MPDGGQRDGGLVFGTAWSQGWRPPADITVTAWAEANVVLAGKTASEPGPYRVSRTPYAREPMDLMGARSSVPEIVLKWGSQTSKSTMALNCLGYWIDIEPAPALLVEPTLDLAKRFSRQQIASMIESTAALQRAFAHNRSRDESNTILMKDYAGGCLVIAGANSAAGLRMMPARYVLKDEVDGYPEDVDGEGDPSELADKRQSTFGGRAKTITTSTPGDDITSRIEPKFEEGSRARYHVPCPGCGELQALQWKNLRWASEGSIEERAASAHYVCQHNGCIIEEHHKAQMLREEGYGGRARWVHERPDSAVKSYHLSSLYSPLGWASWSTLVTEWLKASDAHAKGDATKLKSFINTRLAETWKDQGEQADGSELEERAKMGGHELGIVPAGALVLTASVDVQGNRLEACVVGWGRGEESWLIDYVVMWGEPSDLLSGKDARLDELERRLYRNVHGRDMRIAATAIDSGGHHTQDVYMHVRTRRRSRHVLAIKGSSEGWRPILGKPSDVEIDWRGEKIKRGAQVWPIGTDTAKDLIYNRLRRVKAPGPGYMHFPREGLPEGYFEGLTSEKLITRYHKGRPRREWYLQKGKRNEPLDLAVYALAAAHYAGVTRLRDADFERLERALVPDLFTASPTGEAPAATTPPTEGAAAAAAEAPAPAAEPPRAQQAPRPPAPQPAKPFRRRSNFVNRWKQK